MDNRLNNHGVPEMRPQAPRFVDFLGEMPADEFDFINPDREDEDDDPDEI